jgi:predicted nuclease of predicted toxin-antitoxin system
MKFIVDAQLPKSLSDFLKTKGYDSLHTLELPEMNRTGDTAIAEKADAEGRIVITKDADFLDS